MNHCMLLVITLYLSPWMIMHGKCQDHVNMANMKIEIEKHRQTERIKKQILKELENNGAKVNKADPSSGEQKSTGFSGGPFPRKNPSPDGLDIAPQTDESSTPAANKPILVLGDPANDRKDSCLAFDVGKYIDASQRILPFRVSLWIHVRMMRGKGRRRKKERALDTRTKRNVQQETKRRNRKRKNDRNKNKNKKNKKKKRGRQIKILVSNGTKTLAQIRKIVSKPMWIGMDLPISQLPDVITSQDNFKLCFKCKRCNKKIKLDLFRSLKKQRRKKQSIPFIHFEDRSLLPHTNSRNKRSVDAMTSELTSRRRHQHSPVPITRHLSKQCCREEVYEETLEDVSSSILSPLSINITFCRTEFPNSQPVDNILDNGKTFTDVKCIPKSKSDFYYTYLDKHYMVRHGVIANLIPNSCKCGHAVDA